MATARQSIPFVVPTQPSPDVEVISQADLCFAAADEDGNAPGRNDVEAMGSAWESGAIVTRAQRAGATMAAIAPATVAGIASIRCGCSSAAWIIELVTAALFLLRIWRRQAE